jgi:hypothetical protein
MLMSKKDSKGSLPLLNPATDKDVTHDSRISLGNLPQAEQVYSPVRSSTIKITQLFPQIEQRLRVAGLTTKLQQAG